MRLEAKTHKGKNILAAFGAEWEPRGNDPEHRFVPENSFIVRSVSHPRELMWLRRDNDPNFRVIS